MHSSELIVELKPSSTYGRLLVAVHLLTSAFLSYSSLFLAIKIMLFLLLAKHFYFYYHSKKPHPELQEIKYSQRKWSLVHSNGSEAYYSKLTVLVHNIMFQVIKLSSLSNYKVLVLFNDQLSQHQLRLLHLKALSGQQ